MFKIIPVVKRLYRPFFLDKFKQRNLPQQHFCNNNKGSLCKASFQVSDTTVKTEIKLQRYSYGIHKEIQLVAV